MKVVSKRDSATAALRKLGIDKADYDLFIVKNDSGFVVDTEAAELHASKLKTVNKEPKEPKERTKKSNQKPVQEINEPPKEKESTSAYIRRLILAGYSDAEIFGALQKFKNFDKSKSYYPGWNRWNMRKKGLEV